MNMVDSLNIIAAVAIIIVIAFVKFVIVVVTRIVIMIEFLVADHCCPSECFLCHSSKLIDPNVATIKYLGHIINFEFTLTIHRLLSDSPASQAMLIHYYQIAAAAVRMKLAGLERCWGCYKGATVTVSSIAFAFTKTN